MINCDLHVHTIKSRCGYCTHLEMIDRAAQTGMKAVALTDHGSCSGGYISHALFRIPDSYQGVRIFKGVEVNINENIEEIGLPKKYLPDFDLVLAGYHYRLSGEESARRNSEHLIRFFEKHPYIDIITHPAIKTYPLDFNIVVPYLAQCGVLFEINNKNLLSGKTDLANLNRMIELVLDNKGMFVINSDAHTVWELGDDTGITDFFNTCRQIPEESILNLDLYRVQTFIESRKQLKKTGK